MYGTFNRPISPHLSIYIPQISSMLSILHRFSGLLIIITFLITWFLYKITLNLELILIFDKLGFLNKIWFTNFIILNLSFAIIYHILNGLRFISIKFGFFYNLEFLFIFKQIFIIIIFFCIVYIYFICL
uniref:succinate dehydrogenase subunit 3 n=1 Tax=Heterosiphonia pulchra TaxID=189631 RepID=UPI002E76C808|nr:succinate dehydrogenase subunit 3 [Heterosiphonia pulchra]WQF69560.1 succinate dehydrogenase subunit 3 [Heterosiphonia pulchra]